MLAQIKRVLKQTPVYPIYAKIKHRFRYKNTEKSLIYIHIGKCGGESLWDAIRTSKAIQDQFEEVERVHIFKPPVLSKARYLVVVRNPIKRAISAFNWRYKLVVEDEAQKTRFDGEYDILKKYGTLNAMAEALYVDGALAQDVADEFRVIHHLREDISFYLSDLLKKVKSDQIYSVLATETLNDDIRKILNVQNPGKTHKIRARYRPRRNS